MSAPPRTQYVRIGDFHIAYQSFGEGPHNILFARANQNHLEMQWDDPNFRAFLEGLASFARVVVYDDRGSGMSDPFTTADYVRPAERVDDIIAVLDRVGVDRAVLIAESFATFRVAHVAAAHPERVAALVLCNGLARATRTSDYAFGLGPDDLEGGRWLSGTTPELAAWLTRYGLVSVARGQQRTFRQVYDEDADRDVRAVLPAVRVPTLVIEHTTWFADGTGRDLAERIPDARYIRMSGRAFYGWRFDDPLAVVNAIEEFVTGEPSAPRADRVLATMLFTDVVDSTERAATLGDWRWRSTLDSLDSFTKRQIDRFGGRLIKSTGDGHLATFDSPGRAILCACAIRDGVNRFEIEIRAGLHTGEIDLRGDDIGGMAVNIARRVCDLGDTNDILVSRTVTDLVAGSGLEFDDRGEHDLKGVPGRWELYAVKS